MTSVTETPDEERRRKNAERTRAYRAANKEKIRAKEREYYQKNREKRLAYEATPERRAARAARMRAARAKDPEKHRLQFRAWSYSITVERLQEILAGGCDVCGSDDRLHVDHDHSCCPAHPTKGKRSCGKCVRGALCHGCNTALGLLKEDPVRIEALLAHVRGFTPTEESTP